MERVLSNVLNEKSVTTPQLSHLGTHQIVLNAMIPTTVILKRNEKGKNNAVWKEGRGWEGLTPVDSSSLRQQQQQCLSIFHWLRWSLEEANSSNSSCGSHSGAPCVASLPPLVNSTTAVVGLWELPGLSLLRHYNMLNSPQRLPDWHQCIVWTVQWGPRASKKHIEAHQGICCLNYLHWKCWLMQRFIVMTLWSCNSNCNFTWFT